MATDTITVLFTDLVGSTELLSRVGPDRAEELRREHFAVLRDAIAEAAGREVKNLGDGLMVVFDGPAAAMSCAVGMQQRITSRRSDEPLTIRVGVAVGEADVDDDDYFGPPVVEAARLCAAASGGEVLVTDLVRLLARGRGGFDLDPVGALELKGLDDPVETFRLRWEPAAATDQPPLPPRLVSALSATFVGRTAETATLGAAWKDAVSGERRVVLLSGEPGIGKTTLTSQLARRVHDEGAVVLYGRNDEDLGVPYQPWIEALGQLVTHAPDEVLAAHVEDRGAHLARLVPELARRTGAEVTIGADGDAERFVLFGCVGDLLARSARDRPILLVLDDLHWADRPTTQLIRHVVTDVTGPICILGTYRDSDITAGDPTSDLLAALHREQGVDRVPLTGLTDLDLLDLLERVAGHDLDEQGLALRDAVLAETAGNPFFVGEVLRHLTESGALVQDDSGRWVAAADLRSAGLPVSVREVIGRRVAHLGADAERLLTLASVIGRDFDVGLLAAVADVDEDDAIDVCDAAVAASVLQDTDEADRYTFTHALIEHTLYDSLSAARRSRAHRAVAEALEDAVGPAVEARAGELAYHWGQAVAPTDTAKAAQYAQLAGDRALDQLAPDEAVRWYVQALDLLDREAGPDEGRRAAVLVGLGAAQRQIGDPAHRETLLRAAALADASDDVALLVRAVLANSRGWQSTIGATDHDRIAMIERSLDRLGPVDTVERAQLLIQLAVEQVYSVDLGTRLARTEEAIATARSAGDGRVLAIVFHRACSATKAPETLQRRAAWLDEARPLVDAIDDPYESWNVAVERATAALEQGDLDGIRRNWDLAVRAADRTPDAGIAWVREFESSWLAVLEGDLGEAERLAGSALELGLESGQPDAFTLYGVELAGIRWHEGRMDELIPMIEEILEGDLDLDAYRGTLALAHARSGSPDAAARLLDAATEAGFVLPVDSGWTTAQVNFACAASVVGHRDAALVLRPLLEPFHDQLATTTITIGVPVAHALGLLDHVLGDLDAADAWFARAHEMAVGLECPPLVATTEAAWAALLVDRDRGDDRERARAMAEDALRLAVDGGYGYAERDARAVLDRLGV